MATTNSMSIWTASIAPHAEDDAISDVRDDAHQNNGT
eukprot:CAMPEP_0172583690 /NCGR_PEP_ID=MMETSP1068-20121228/3268_1 /TAXON_ID=35684 /ORGANISM="Pseudopedinella elastica, Strain CCMP716" /LENGTH=36 /DNA_ID= /DNA_START= /DNA_END= /DNA_ORIENTATION=